MSSQTSPQSTQMKKEDPDLKRFLEILNERTKDLNPKISVDKYGRAIYIEISNEKLHELAERLSKLGIDHVKSVTGVDYPSENKIELLIHAGSYLRTLRKYTVIIKSFLDRSSPKTRSLTDVWPSAEFQEREAWEMFGIYFEGHPDLRRLLLPEDFEGMWPMRKDFMIKTRRLGEVEGPWK